MIIPLLIAATVCVLTGIRRHIGLAAILVILPTYLVRTSIAGIPTTALELSITAAAIWLVIDAARGEWRSIVPRLSRGGWIVLALWTAAWILSSAMAADRTAAFGGLKAFWFDPLIVLIMLHAWVRTHTQRYWIIAGLILGGVSVALAGGAQLLWFSNTVQDHRLSSYFHPVANFASMYLGPIIVLIVGLLMNRVGQKIWWGVVGILVLAMVGTMSYGGFLALAAGGVVIWAFLPRTKLKWWLGGSAILVAVIGFSLLRLTPNFAEHFTNADRTSGKVRTQIWQTSWVMIREHPLAGVGMNNFERVYRLTVPRVVWPPLEWSVAKAHNLYLDAWVELGLLGIMSILAVSVWWIRRVLTLLHGSQRPLAIACLAAWAAILAHGFVDTPVLKNDLAIIAVVILALPLLRLRNEN